MKLTLAAAALLLAGGTLAGCATSPGPVEVTRFHDPAQMQRLGSGTVFVESAPGTEGDTLALAPYKAAIARELASLGYTETSRENASQIAQVRVERYDLGPQGRRSPVSVGVGGSTGSYGSGLGLGVGINLGGDGRKVGTELGVMIRDKVSTQVLWEGRARLEVGQKSRLASAAPNAEVVADALFRDFPGGNGETIEVGVSE